MHFFFVIAYFAVILAIVLFVLTMLYRLVKANEQTSRHLLEIARDIKAIAINNSKQ